MSIKSTQWEALILLSTSIIGALTHAFNPAIGNKTDTIFGLVNSAIINYFTVLHPQHLPDPSEAAKAITTLP